MIEFLFGILIGLIPSIFSKAETFRRYEKNEAEARVSELLRKKSLEQAGSYHVIDNVTLANGGKTAQIDHIVVSRYGIFVVETKGYKGWLFGGGKGGSWKPMSIIETGSWRSMVEFKHSDESVQTDHQTHILLIRSSNSVVSRQGNPYAN